MATIPVSNETRSSGSRMTREGKKITYALEVIQQPERARACGSGAKSSADRRPVDPPPIVSLRVFEGEGPNATDVTFSYKANFFLFATLENARAIAQGRMPPAIFPVLTGTPVAGMAYLDRPDPAGYFIFPDLSVRHEGKYRLSFALYEELKDNVDMDPEGNTAIQVQTTGIDAFVSHRLEVKSVPFTVFSAKKFPGLAESTALSRTVAEQGCRVRIRRDVRMRRREDTKGNKDWDNYEDETAEYRAQKHATPDAYGQANPHTPQVGMDGDRPRSASNASHHSSYAAPQRRPSMDQMTQNYHGQYQQQIAPQPQQQDGYQGYPNAQQGYQNGYNGQQQPPQSMMQPPQAPYQHSGPQQAYQQPPAQSQPPAQPSIQPVSQSYGYMPNQNYSPQSYEQPSHRRGESMEYSAPGPYRRAGQPPQHHNGASSSMPGYNVESTPRQHSVSQPMPSYQHAQSSAPSLAPLRTLALPGHRQEPSSPAYSNHGSMGSANDTMSFNGQVPQAGAKRGFGDSFDTRHLNQPLRQGARPASDDYRSFDHEEDDGIERRAMTYRRADGTERSRRVPVMSE